MTSTDQQQQEFLAQAAILSPSGAAATVLGTAQDLSISQDVIRKVIIKGRSFAAILDAAAHGCNTVDPTLSEAACSVDLMRNLVNALRADIERYYRNGGDSNDNQA